MYYVVLEANTEHLSQNPKDQTKIIRLVCQFIDAEKLLPTSNVNNISIRLNYDLPNALQQAVDQLDTIIKENVAGSEFFLCSLFSTWTIRVILQRQAYDEKITLPPWLKQLKIFDLWKEYGRWCDTHPQSSEEDETRSLIDPQHIRLVQLLKRLDLTELYKQNTDQEEEEKIFEDSLDKLQNIDTTIKVLLRLCEYIRDSPNILTHPYNQGLDLKTFQNENSTILYMTNLPLDTTQSELESWFSQYGTRPIGFWTFKNILDDISTNQDIWKLNQYSYLEELNSISGFAIFSNHENAMEALCLLNGRSMLSNVANTRQPRVVEHIIELQPSSKQVIDMAQEILSPFPQSKNKPRPGDWNCPSCGFLNFQRRTACFRCSFPIPSSFQKIKTGKSATSIDNNNNIKSNFEYNGKTDINKNHSGPDLTLHENNNTNNYSTNSLGTTQKLVCLNTVSPHNNNSNNKNAILNSYNNTNNNNHYAMNPYNSNIPFRAGDWKCGVCDYHNFAKNIVCLRCGGPKTSPVPKAII